MAKDIKKLHRSRDDKMLGGICGGIGEMLSIDPTLIRLVVAFVGVMTWVLPVIVIYILGWFIIPESNEA